MEKVYIDSDLIGRSFICSLLSAITLSLVFILLRSTYFSFMELIIFSLIIFFFYLFIATPLQIKLNQKPKSFSIKYLLIYLIGSAITNAVLLMTMHQNPFNFPEFYLMVLAGAIIFWIYDSVLLQQQE